MYIKIVNKNYTSKNSSQRFNVGEEYCSSDNGITEPYNFTNDDNVGDVYSDYFAPTHPRELRFLEIKPIETNDMDYEFNRLSSKKIKIERELPLEEIIKIDKSQKIFNTIKFLDGK